jgi:hypothetical protein
VSIPAPPCHPIDRDIVHTSRACRWKNAANACRLSIVDAQSAVRLGTVLLFGLEHHLWLAGLLAGGAYTLPLTTPATLWVPRTLASRVTHG